VTPSWLVAMGDGLDHRLDGPYFLDHQYHRRSTGINFLELLLPAGWRCHIAELYRISTTSKQVRVH